MAGGLAAAAVALGVTQILAMFFPPAADSRTAVGTAVINLTPGPVKEWAIQTFGTSDKAFLTVMVVVVVATLCAVAAIWERTRIPLGSLTVLAAGAGSLAVLAQPGAGVTDIVPTVIGAICGVATLRVLTAAAPRGGAGPDPDRRRSLLTLACSAGVLGGVAGTVLDRQRRSVAGERDVYSLPAPASPAPPFPRRATGRRRSSELHHPNEDFYRIDTALSVPQIARSDWSLRIHGMVDREITYTRRPGRVRSGAAGGDADPVCPTRSAAT